MRKREPNLGIVSNIPAAPLSAGDVARAEGTQRGLNRRERRALEAIARSKRTRREARH